MDIPNTNNKRADPIAAHLVLKPINRQMANAISNAVATKPINEIILLGNHGFICWVYAKKLDQFPQTEFFTPHQPKRSATAEINEKDMEILINTIIYLLFILLSFENLCFY